MQYFIGKLLPEERGSIPYLPTTADLLKFLEEKYPEQTALSDTNRTVTYRELVQHAGCRRSLLAKRGIQPGTNIGILGRNSIEAVEWFLAVTSFGCTAVMLPAVMQPEVLAGAIPFYEIGAVIPDAEQLPKLSNIQVPCIGITEEDDSPADAKAVKKTDRAAVFFTGGTTGKPKGVILSHGAIMRGSLNGTYRPGTMYGQTLIAVLPFTHVFGLIFSMLSALYAGSHVAVCGNMNMLFNEMMRVKPTTMIAVPGMAEIMLNVAKAKGPAVLGGRLKTIVCGAAPVPEKLHEEFLQFGVEVLAGYGMTETANLVSGNLSMELHPTSVGCQYPEQEMRVVDGDLQVKGDMLFDGYWKDPKGTDAAFTEDGWLRTGDLARIEPDGFLYIVGRIKNLIILDNGENVSPEEVEAFYYRSNLIRDCLCSECVINGKAAIQLEVLANPGVSDEEVTKETERIGRELPSYMQPAKIVLRHEEFEKSASMKIIRK